MDELETMLRIRVDRRELDEALRQIQQDLDRGITAAFARAARGGAAGGAAQGGVGAGGAPPATSTAAPSGGSAMGGPGAPASVGGAGGGAGAPPAVSTGAGSGGGGGGGGSTWTPRPRNAQGQFVGAAPATSTGAGMPPPSTAPAGAGGGGAGGGGGAAGGAGGAASTGQGAGGGSGGGGGGSGGGGGRQAFRPGWKGDYMVGGPGRTLDLMPLMSGNPAGAVIAAGGSALRNAALRRATEIERAREAGVPESDLPTMGLLRYANPVSATAAVATAGVTKALGESASAGDRFASMSRDLAFGAMAGAFPAFTKDGRFDAKAAFTRAADPRLGAMTPEEVAAHGRAMGGQIGYTRVSDEGRASLWQARNTGTSEEAINAFVANERLGVKGEDPRNFIGLAQSQGLFGVGVDRLLQLIAQNTQAMAMKGVRVDQTGLFDLLRAMRFTPGLEGVGERGVSALNSLGSLTGEIGDELYAPYRQMGRAYLTQHLLKGGGTYQDLMGRFESFAGSPSEQLKAIQAAPAGQRGMVAKAVMRELTLDEARSMSDPGAIFDESGAARHRDKKFELQTLDSMKDGDGSPLLGWAAIAAAIGAKQMESVGTKDAYEWQKWSSANWDRMFQDVGAGFSDLSATFTSEVRSMSGEVSDKLQSLEEAVRSLKRD